MHELSIALSIVDIAEEAVKKAGAKRVNTIELDIGECSGIELAALDFAWPQAVQHSVLEDARRIIHTIKAKGQCPACGYKGPAEDIYAFCPNCDAAPLQLVEGRELKVKALEVS